MLPLHQWVVLNREMSTPVYLQISGGLIRCIQEGKLLPGWRLPGSRQMAMLWEVHRQTVIRALEELEIQGWLQTKPNKGVFVAEQLPNLQPQPVGNLQQVIQYDRPDLVVPPFLSKPVVADLRYNLDDGLPDVRLAPIDEMARTYARLLRNSKQRQLSYGDAQGSQRLREGLVEELRHSRGLRLDSENLLITRGSQMAIYLTAASILRPGDRVLVGKPNYFTANLTFRYLGAELVTVSVDEKGLVVSEMESILEKTPVRMIYVTPHHHHPTTVTLAPERRLQLLELARRRRIIILEDDYDFDFHYSNKPILPLAGASGQEQVIYIGSFTKCLAPVFRVGYIAAPKPWISEMVKVRRLLDRQGDVLLEDTIAHLLEQGLIRRALKKSWQQYRLRRDHAVSSLQEISDYISFRPPDGGLAIWAQFKSGLSVSGLSERLSTNGVYLSNGYSYQQGGAAAGQIRMGFASMREEEWVVAIELLKQQIEISI